MKSIILISLTMLLFNGYHSMAQNDAIKRVEPLNWWTGMANPNLQIMIYGNNIAANQVSINYPGVELKHTIKTENPNYLFLDLTISPIAKPGNVVITFKTGKKVTTTYNYQLQAREQGSAERIGFNSSDAIYLIMPDRFANGNGNNDSIATLKEKRNRKAPYGRHGGDLKGIENHLDYIQQLGMTALWLNPVQENNQPESSYHGYAISDYYHIDARLGSNADYKVLCDACRKRGMKMIMDMVFNHCGIDHWWMKDLPMKDWVNQWDTLTRSNFRLSTIADPHVSQADLKQTTQGWFDTSMPDLNLKNELLLTYMIQNSIWWVEYAGLQGIRQDTYPYPDKEGMRKWNLRISEEYPNFNIVGESWITAPSKLCYWQKDFPNKDGYNSELPSLMDFPLMAAINRAFNEKESWDDGLIRLYDVLADDHLYPNPDNMVVFPENHDAGRIMHYLNNDIRKFKMAMAFVATTRGIPQLYYGSELLMAGDGVAGHANIRQDFPGGWPGDSINAFTPQGRTKLQNEAVDYMSTIFSYRKNNPVLHTGKLIHFIPENEMYVYFRVGADKAVMVILNNSEKKKQTLQTKRFAEVMQSYTQGKNIVTGEKLTHLNQIDVPAKSAVIIELNK